MHRHSVGHAALPRAAQFAERVHHLFLHLSHNPALAGLLLLACALLALAWANSPYAASYYAFWQTPVTLAVGQLSTTQSLQFWINDGLMTVFFLAVGMEIRREMHDGALASLRLAALPLAAALGGVMVPAGIYLSLNGALPQRQGWAIPTATDIAFAVGVLALLGKAVPGSVRIFLLTLAILDDIMAVLIIAVFYSDGLGWQGLAIALMGMLLATGMQRVGVGRALPYLLPGAVVWAGLLAGGVHPTLAGVAMGLITPVVPLAQRDTQPPVLRVQHALHPWVAFLIMPAFALANAGVTVDIAGLADDAALAVMQGTTWALLIGKPLGIVVFAALAIRLLGCQLPTGMSWREVGLVGILAGIGFTMSIFIATLAFPSPALLASAKLGVLLASFTAICAGLAWGLALRSRWQAEARRDAAHH
ncbi:Na+/H+ antiporter NhaA type [plant metagenome]|uniref:Na+/H+ antiporter NhaA type n=1 Tax=plant metagenome TaxID=1297885 RepID=A0A484XBK5_9ZZZZ